MQLTLRCRNEFETGFESYSLEDQARMDWTMYPGYVIVAASVNEMMDPDDMSIALPVTMDVGFYNFSWDVEY